MKRPHRNSGGFAILLTLLIFTLLVTVTFQFNTSMTSELYAAANLRDNARLGSIAKSGFHYAIAVLFEDANAENEFDSLHEAWANFRALSANSSSMYEDGRFEVRIVDHSGRIQINQLLKAPEVMGEEYIYNMTQKDLLTRFLRSEEFDLDEETVDDLVDALKDWMDPDHEVTGFGAENSYYQTLDKPYACKNGPVDSLEELLLVRGISRELFYGTDEMPGIASYLTTQGNDGKININTAHPLVLSALSEHLDQEMVEEMIAYREDEDNDLSSISWYKGVRGMSSEVSIDHLVSTSSHVFEIRSTGIMETMSKRVEGLVERKEGAIRIVSWKSE
ncbi:MAG: type II secretion system minor pseudopilin GspK [Deltaproteobacteria bacterium]|nr:type II secretion system minor pseudopilin GspK [Deltaproteobacteria bacterium]